MVLFPQATIYFDGGSRGNPGLAAGAAVVRGKKEQWQVGEILETATNNQAEYTGLIVGLKKALDLQFNHVEVRGDSQLIIAQMNGDYGVKSRNLIAFYHQARQLADRFEKIIFIHIPRAENKEADAECNRLMNNYLGKKSKPKQANKLKNYPEGFKGEMWRLIDRGSGRTFKEMANLKVPKKCEFSRKRIKTLKSLLAEAELEIIHNAWLSRNNKLPEDKYLAQLYRWYLRGKGIEVAPEELADLACHKVRVDAEITSNIVGYNLLEGRKPD